jgi:hypothetical protein
MTDAVGIADQVTSYTQQEYLATRHGDMLAVRAVFEQTDFQTATAAFAALSDATVIELARDIDAIGSDGSQGLNADEKRDLFVTLAKKVDGRALARLSVAFGQLSRHDNALALQEALEYVAVPDSHARHGQLIAAFHAQLAQETAWIDKPESPPGGVPLPNERGEALSEDNPQAVEADRQWNELGGRHLDRAAQLAGPFIRGAFSAPFESTRQLVLIAADGLMAQARAEIMQGEAYAQAFGGGLSTEQTVPARPHPRSEPLSDLMISLEYGSESLAGGRASAGEIIARELPVLGIPFALHGAYRACSEAPAETCAETVGGLVGGAVALERLIVKSLPLSRTRPGGDMPRLALPGPGMLDNPALPGTMPRFDVFHIEPPLNPSLCAITNDLGAAQGGNIPGRRSSLVELGPYQDLPTTDMPKSLFKPSAAMTALTERMQSATPIDFKAIAGEKLGEGSYHQAFADATDPARLGFKISKDGHMRHQGLSAYALQSFAIEGGALLRGAEAGMSVIRADGLIPIRIGPNLTPSLSMERIPDAINFRDRVEIPVYNAVRYLAHGPSVGFSRKAAAAPPLQLPDARQLFTYVEEPIRCSLTRSTLDGLAQNIDANLRHGFAFDDSQALMRMSAPTGQLYAFDPNGVIEAPKPSALHTIQWSVYIHNAIADLLNQSRLPMPQRLEAPQKR